LITRNFVKKVAYRKLPKKTFIAYIVEGTRLHGMKETVTLIGFRGCPPFKLTIYC